MKTKIFLNKDFPYVKKSFDKFKVDKICFHE